MNPLRCPACSLASDLQVSGSGIDHPAADRMRSPDLQTRNLPEGGRAVLRGHLVPISGILRLAALAWLLVAAPVHAADEIGVTVTYLAREEPPLEPLSLVEPILADEGLMGARQALDDNQTTGQFPRPQLPAGRADRAGGRRSRRRVRRGAGRGRASVHRRPSRRARPAALAPMADAAGALLFNGRAEDDELRTETCSASILHVAPSRAMKADALAQYLIWKQWPDWFLMHGTRPADVAFADAIRRAAHALRREIVEEREYEFVEFARRTDFGPRPGAAADAGVHPGRARLRRAGGRRRERGVRRLPAVPHLGPAAGGRHQGLVPTSWSRVHEQWGGTQLQRRFENFAGRPMTERDFNAWLAVRSSARR